MLDSGSIRDFAAREWSVFWGLTPLVKLIVGLSLLFVCYLALTCVSDTAASYGDKVTAWWFDRSDTKAVKEITEAKSDAAAEKAQFEAERRESAVWRTKYELAIKAMNAEHQNGSVTDAEINEQVERLAQTRSGDVSASGVDDDEFLRALRARQDAAGRSTRPRDRR